MADTKQPLNAPLPQACAIVLAGGTGSRARLESHGDVAKQFVELGGKPLLAWSLDSLSKYPGISDLVLVLPPDAHEGLDTYRTHVSVGVQLIVTTGGATRRDSTLAGLRAWTSTPDYRAEAPILIHDGARPFVTSDLIERLLQALETHSGAIPTLRVSDTLKQIVSDETALVVQSGPDRNQLVTVQTPQAFRGFAIVDAHERVEKDKPDQEFTDDASILEWAGGACVGVDGDPRNIKVTAPQDWDRAEANLASKKGDKTMWEPRTGIGYDVHRLVPGDGVWLCGHFIEHSYRLDGHSDADVGLHALTDAILGALGEGDIGTHFPPSDPQWRGAASHIFLEHAAERVLARGGRIANVDVAIVAENPKVGPHRSAMTSAMAKMLGIAEDRVSVKATTNEKLGFAGREEGIAALATAMIMVPDDE